MLRKVTILMKTQVPKCGDVYTPQEYHKAMGELQKYICLFSFYAVIELNFPPSKNQIT